MNFRTTTVVLAALALMTGILTGQTYRGAIAGSVADSSGAAVADAVVKIVNKGTGLTRTQNTPSAGDFSFPDLALGIYTITVTRTGFQSFSEEVEATVGKITSVAITLGVAGQTQTVEVQAAAAALETNEAVLNAVVDTRAVEEIPLNARDFTQLLKLTPGYNDQGAIQSSSAPTDTNSGVARVSLIHGDVSTQRGNAGDWSAAALSPGMLIRIHTDSVLSGRIRAWREGGSSLCIQLIRTFRCSINMNTVFSTAG